MWKFPHKWFLRTLIVSGFVATMPFANVSGDEQNESKAMYEMIDEKGYRCLECHDVELKVVGPSWKEVSARRKGDPWAMALIRYKLSEEGAGIYGFRGSSSGEYGDAVMPHHEISDEDAQKITQWILGLDKPKVSLVVEKK